jgi:predicted transcriptional regulator
MNNEELKKIREDKGLKKGEFATLLRVTPMIYGRYESGTLAIPEKVGNAVRELAGDKGSDKTVVDAAVAYTAVAAKKQLLLLKVLYVKQLKREERGARK